MSDTENTENEDLAKAGHPDEMSKFSFENPLKGIQEALSFFNAVKELDSDKDGVPDYINLLSYGASIYQTVTEFIPKTKSLALPLLVVEFGVAFASVKKDAGLAIALVQTDVAALKAEFPDLMPKLPPPPYPKA